MVTLDQGRVKAVYQAVLDKFANQQCVVLDGGIGTELQRQRVEESFDAYHFTPQDQHVMM